MLPAEEKKLAHHACGLCRGIANLRQVCMKRIGFGRFLQRQGRIAGNYRKKVVEIMGHSPGQCADGLHFLGLKELGHESFLFLFKTPALGGVGKKIQRGGLAAPINPDSAYFHPFFAPADGHQPEFIS